MEALPPHVARLVRDKTLQSSAKLFDTAMSYAHQRINATVKQGVPPQKSVPKVAKVTHETLEAHGVGLGYMVTRHPRYKKRVFALVGSWSGFVSDTQIDLLAHYRVLARGSHSGFFTARVSRHALERVSERRGTISPSDVRMELAPAVNGLLLAASQDVPPKAGDELAVLTENGVAIAYWGDARVFRTAPHALTVPTITTWMSWDVIPASSPLRQLKWDFYDTGPTQLVHGCFVGAVPALPQPRPRGSSNEDESRKNERQGADQGSH
jgi:hypothetical protein